MVLLSKLSKFRRLMVSGIGFMCFVISRFRGFHRFRRFHNRRFHQERIVSWELFVVPWVL